MKKLLLFCLLISCISTNAQDFSKYEKRSLTLYGNTLNYRILYPENFDHAKKYPVLFFLHGSGERGNDNEKQLLHGGKIFLDPAFRSSTAAIIIFPQCDESSFWANVKFETINEKRFLDFQAAGDPTMPMSLLMGLTEEILRQPYADRHKIYVGGLSMGGMGTLELIRRMPKVFAAAFAICGGDNVANARKYKNIPLWLFHGGADDVVSPEFSYAIFSELRRLGKEPKFTVYPKVGHNSWDPAFAEKDFLPWIFAQKKG